MDRSTRARQKPPRNWVLSGRNRTLLASQPTQTASTKKSDMRWLQKWDLSRLLLENVDLANSQSAINIPMISESISIGLQATLSISYTSSDVSTNGLVGNGWTLHNTQEYIVLNHKLSLFPENYEYQLMTEGQTIPLYRNETRQAEFYLKDQEDIKIVYDQIEERWTLESPYMTTVYGKSKNASNLTAHQISLQWPAWRGPGINENALEPVVVAWYLVSKEERTGAKKKLLYNYLTEKRKTPLGKEYTSVIQLESISDLDNNFRLNLRYGLKSVSEYIEKSERNSDQYFQFPVPLSPKYFLVEFELQTTSYQQIIHFNYTQNGRLRTLDSISQFYKIRNKDLSEPIFSFDYKEMETNKFFLDQITIPSYQSSIRFEYTKLQIPLIKFETESLNTLRYPAFENVEISQGNDFGIMAYDSGTGGIFLRMFNRQLTRYTKDMYTCPNNRFRLPTDVSTVQDQYEIKQFGAIVFEDLVAVVEDFDDFKRLSLFHRENATNEWPNCPDHTIKLGKNALFRYSENIMAIMWNPENTSNVLTVIEPIPNSSKKLENFPDGYWVTNTTLQFDPQKVIQRMIVRDRQIFAFNNQSLTGFKRNDDTWSQYLIDTYSSSEEALLGKFTMNDTISAGILEQIRLNGLHAADNMVLQSRMTLLPNRIDTYVKLHLLDDNLRVKTQRSFLVKSEVINSMVFKQELEDGTKFEFKYKYNDSTEKYEGFLDNITGFMFDDGCKDEKDKDECKKILIEYLQEQNGEDFKEIIIFDPEPFMKIQLDQFAVTTSTKKLLVTGNSWQPGDSDGLTKNMKIGNDYVLRTVEDKDKSETKYTLYRQNPVNGQYQGAALDSFVLGQTGTMAVGYPSYLAIQPDVSNRPELFLFRNMGQDMPRIPFGERGERLLSSSNQEILITIKKSSDPNLAPFDHEVIVRRVNSIVPSSPMWTLARSEVNNYNETRIRSYINSFSCIDSTISQQNSVVVVPTGDKSFSGWYEENTVVPIDDPRNATKTQNWFDSNGNLIDSKDVEENLRNGEPDEDDEESEQKDYRIWDSTEQLQIVETAPYNVSLGMVAHLGFETYEKNSQHFVYPVGSVLENEFPLTGQRILRLRSSNRISGTFAPYDQVGTYIASSWIRGHQDVEIKYTYGDPIECFKATLNTHFGLPLATIYGQIKNSNSNWMYVELAVDLDKVRNNLYSELYRRSDRNAAFTPPSKTNFTIDVKIDSMGHTSVDVDHIRFAPASMDLHSKVYNSQTGIETEVIFPNGAILKRIHDIFGIEIGTVGETGQIEQIVSISSSATTFPLPQVDNMSALPALKKEIVMIPDFGFYENFDKFSLNTRWIFENETSWLLTGKGIKHLSMEPHKMTCISPATMFDPSSSAVRLLVDFETTDSILTFSFYGYSKLVSIAGDGTLNVGNDCRRISNLPQSGDLIVYLENETIWIWFDSILLADMKLTRGCLAQGSFVNSSPWKDFELEIGGEVFVSNFITLSRPKVTVAFKNAWGDTVQSMQLENVDTVLVSQTLHDQVGRDAIKAKATRVKRRSDRSSMLNYIQDFIVNSNYNENDSVFSTGILKGLVSDLNPSDDGYPYNRDIYFNDMLREVKIEGLPGQKFSTTGSFKKTHDRFSRIPFLQILFPSKDGFIEKVTYETGGSILVIVEDKKGKEVAEYTKVAGFDNVLTINEYDREGNLLKILPPAYHQQMNTFGNYTTPWKFGDENLSAEEKHWQDQLGTHYKYDEFNQLIYKKTPDAKPKGYIYDMIGNMRFMYNLNYTNETNGTSTEVADEIVYMLSIARGEPVEIGYLDEQFTVSELRQFTNSTSVPGTSHLHQRVMYSYSHSDPEVRRRAKMFLTYGYLETDPLKSGVHPPHQELLQFNSADHVIMKTSNTLYSGSLTTFSKYYQGGDLTEIQYPAETENTKGKKEPGLSLICTHDALGKLTRLGTRSHTNQFMEFEYNAAGQIEQESVEPGTENVFTRTYEYEGPGMLVKINDPYLSQNMTFIEGGYGQHGHGDGIIMQSLFEAKWSNFSNLDAQQKLWFRLPVESFDSNKVIKMCLTALKRVGILDEETNIPLKFLTQDLLSKLPLACKGSVGYELMKLIAKYVPPTAHYGHRYAYGSHKELVKAKFFADNESETTENPLQIQSFLTRIDDLSMTEAEDIWNRLYSNSYIIIDNGNIDDKLAAIGKQGTKPIFCYAKLQNDLAEIDQDIASVFASPILQLIYHRLHLDKTNEAISLQEFQNQYIEWHGYLDMETPLIIINRAKEMASKIFTMLTLKNYLTTNLLDILDESFFSTFQPYIPIINDITHTLQTHFQSQIGLNLLDYESYRIDPNGNHLMFYSGFTRHELEYVPNTNKVAKLRIKNPYALPGEDEEVSELLHDSQGNISKAPHRGIAYIKYHPVTSRPVLLELTDGRRIIIKYDAQSERLLKRVFRSDNTLMSETKYLRDEEGSVLMDKRSRFSESGQMTNEITTTYLYGPRKTIIAFIRNNKFYSVFTDHSGSIRLITHRGRVVAGYDYWPYGELFKAFGEEEDQLMYRFTGQEYDEETGLYNYHARIYDPTIGRFYQPDPKGQYASPYIYGGNSPVSLVDPDGEFFMILFAIFGAVFGAYMAAAAANGSFNPLKWNWKSGKTWLALIGGAIGGAMLPYSVAAAGWGALLGIPGMYLKAVMQNGSWNPADWNWSDPATYNAFFEGFSFGVSVATSAIGLKDFAKQFSKTGQIIIYSGAAASSAGLALYFGAMANGGEFKFWKWDFKNPATYSAILDGFISGAGITETLSRVSSKSIRDGKFKRHKTPSRYARTTQTPKDAKGFRNKFKILFSGDKVKIKNYLLDKHHPFFKVAGDALLFYQMNAVASGSFDPTKWDWKSFSTYESVINAYKRGAAMSDMVTVYRYTYFNSKITSGRKYPTQLRSFSNNFSQNMKDLFGFFSANGFSNTLSPKTDNQTLFLTKSLRYSNKESDSEWDSEISNLISGLQAGASIVTAVSDELYDILDCVSIPTAENSTTIKYSNCYIGDNEGRVPTQNRELVNQMFLPSENYQSKHEFSQVTLPREPSNFVEKILSLFHPENNLSQVNMFYESFFVGSIFNSLQTNSNQSNSSRLLFGIQQLPPLDLNMLHITKLLRPNRGNDQILLTRVVIVMSSTKYQAVKDSLAQKLSSQNPMCIMPVWEQPSQIVKIQAEILAIVESDISTQLYILTPDYTPDAENCDGLGFTLSDIPVSSIDPLQSFNVLQNDQSTLTEKMANLEGFMQDTSSAFQEMISLVMPSEHYHLTFVPFLYGFLHANLKETFHLYLKLQRSPGGSSILVIPKRNLMLQEILTETPIIIWQSNASEVQHQGAKLLHNAALLTNSVETLFANIIQEKDGVEIQNISSQPTPTYGGILDHVFNRDTSAVSSLVKFLFYSKEFSTGLNDNHENAGTDTNLHFVSNFFLGELLGNFDTSVEVFALVPESQTTIAAQRLFFVRNTVNSRCTILNIIESSKETDGNYEFDPNVSMDVENIPDVDIDFLQVYEIKLNINSNSGWSFTETGQEVPEQQYFFQGITVKSIDHGRIARNSSVFLKFETPMQNESTRVSFTNEFIISILKNMENDRLQTLINTENDFRSTFLGILTQAAKQTNEDIDGVSLVLRKFVKGSNTEQFSVPMAMSLFSAWQNSKRIPSSEQILAASLKISESGNEQEIEESLVKAKEELSTFSCSLNQRIEQVFLLPGVYNTQDEKLENITRIKYDLNPNVNCTAPENPAEFFFRNGGKGKKSDTKYLNFCENRLTITYNMTFLQINFRSVLQKQQHLKKTLTFKSVIWELGMTGSILWTE